MSLRSYMTVTEAWDAFRDMCIPAGLQENEEFVNSVQRMYSAGAHACWCALVNGMDLTELGQEIERLAEAAMEGAP